MKTKFTSPAHLVRLLLACLLVIGFDACNRTQDQINPTNRSGAKIGDPQPQGYPEIYEDDQLAGEPVALKTVGVDSYDEDADFRLYPTAIACQAYEYLFLHAFATGSNEVGAYITSRGIVIGPNSLGQQHEYHFRTWGATPNTRNPFLYTDKGTIAINGMMHTHPDGIAEPTNSDKIDLAARFDIPQYFIANLNIYLFNSNGTTTVAATYNQRKCQ